jgi:hypothetical protein
MGFANFLSNKTPSRIHGFERSYTLAYSVCYIVAPFMGLYATSIGFIPSALLLIGIGLGLLVGTITENRYIMMTLALSEAMGCVGHYLKIVPWVPAFSDTAYMIMAVLDLIQCVCLFKMLEKINLAKGVEFQRHQQLDMTTVESDEFALQRSVDDLAGDRAP